MSIVSLPSGSRSRQAAIGKGRVFLQLQGETDFGVVPDNIIPNRSNFDILLVEGYESSNVSFCGPFMGNSASLEVEEREASKLQTGEVIQREGPFVLYALKYTRSIWYETILNENVFSPKHFSLFRLQDRVAAERQFEKVCTQLMPFCQGSQECYNKKTLKRLLSCLEENKQWSPVHVAVHAGISSCLSREEFKKHLDSTSCNGGQTPLLLACDLGDVKCVKVLLELGVNVETVGASEEKKCSVHVAAEKSPECLEALLCSEVVVNKYGNQLSHLVNNSTALSQTPLHIACRYKQVNAASMD